MKGLKWITYLNPNNPEKELENLKTVVKFLKEDKSKKILITEYQILAPIAGIYDFSPNQWHHPSVSFPLKDQKYFEIYKKFFIESLKKNKIQFILETSGKNQAVTELILDQDCIKKIKLNEMLIQFELLKICEDLK